MTVLSHTPELIMLLLPRKWHLVARKKRILIFGYMIDVSINTNTPAVHDSFRSESFLIDLSFHLLLHPFSVHFHPFCFHLYNRTLAAVFIGGGIVTNPHGLCRCGKSVWEHKKKSHKNPLHRV